MNWHYAVGGQQQGPVDDTQLDALIQSGTVNADTLVWREGMSNWQPLRQVRPSGGGNTVLTAPPVVAGGAPAAGEVVCAECGKIFTKDNAIQYGTAWVCAACKPVFLQRMREGASPNVASVGMAGVGDVHYAGFWIRFVAKFVDGIVAAVVIGIPFVILLFGVISASPRQPPGLAGVGLQVALQFFAMLFGVAYNTFMIGKWGATLGKMAVGIRVLTPEGQPISYMRAFGRAWADLLSGMVCYIGYIIAAFDSEKRALHDHICSTRVVYK